MLSPPSLLLSLLAALILTPTLTLARPPLQGSVSFAQLFDRDTCAGTICGWQGQLCCGVGQACYTDASNQAQCSATTGAVQATQTAAGGYWQYYTTIYTQTDLATVTSVVSSYVGGAATTVAVATATPTCSYALGQQQCGSICCASDQYCFDSASSQCTAAAAGGSSGYYTSYYSTMYASTNAAGVPLRPTSSTLIVVTETSAPTTTVAFIPPVATGANMTITTSSASTSSGLSGGAIAGIVIGVLLGLALLALLIFYCCIRGLWAVIFGRKRKERRTEVDVYERHSHHGSGAAAGRTWYGASRPARVERRDEHKGRNALAIGGALAGLWAVLGLKRRSKRREEEKSEYSYSSDYYTSASSASSDDRRTRDTRRSQSRR